jgi:predicted MFS family arabinose efflux permease
MRRVLRTRGFARLWLASLISLTGDWVLFAALPYEMYRRTGSTVTTAAIVIAALVPAVAFGSLAGVLVDRWDRRRTLIAVNIVQGAALLPLLGLEQIGTAAAYVTVVIAASMKALFVPAEVAFVPEILGDHVADLATANALRGLGDNSARLIGPAAGGFLVALGGLGPVVAVDLVSFAIAAVLIAGIASPPRRGRRIRARDAGRRLFADWRAGARAAVQSRLLRATLIFALLIGAADGIYGTLAVPFVTRMLQSDSIVYGGLLAAQAIGGLAGSLIIAAHADRLRPAQMMAGGAVAIGLIDLAIFTYPLIAPVAGPALAGMVVAGLPAAALVAGFATLQQTATTDDTRGRVVGTMTAATALGMLVGAAVAGWLGDVVDIVWLLCGTAGCWVGAGVIVAVASTGSGFDADIGTSHIRR